MKEYHTNINNLVEEVGNKIDNLLEELSKDNISEIKIYKSVGEIEYLKKFIEKNHKCKLIIIYTYK